MKPTKKSNKHKGLDRNFVSEAQDKKQRELAKATRTRPEFRKFVNGKVARESKKQVSQATRELQKTIDLQAKRIGRLSFRCDALGIELEVQKRVNSYINDFLSRWATIASSVRGIAKYVLIALTVYAAGYWLVQLIITLKQ